MIERLKYVPIFLHDLELLKKLRHIFTLLLALLFCFKNDQVIQFLLRVQAIANLGQKGSKWSHQAYH